MENKDNTTLYLCNNIYGLSVIYKNNVYIIEDDEFVEDVFKKKEPESIKYKWIPKNEFDQREQEIALKATRS